MMNGNQSKLRTIIGISAVLLTASVAQAAIDNPLDPSYYSHKVTVIHSQPVGIGMPYSDSGNPLHPSFSRAGAGNWQVTVAAVGVRYVDRNNPLHPSYEKNQ